MVLIAELCSCQVWSMYSFPISQSWSSSPHAVNQTGHIWTPKGCQMFLLSGYWEAVTFKGQKSFGCLLSSVRRDGVGWWGSVRTGEQHRSWVRIPLLQGLSGHLHCPNGVKPMGKGSCFGCQSLGEQTVEFCCCSHILYPVCITGFLLALFSQEDRSQCSKISLLSKPSAWWLNFHLSKQEDPVV